MNTELVEATLSAHGRRLVVLDDGEVDDDLVRDMVEVLTSFCARLYGRRSARNRALKAVGCAQRDMGRRQLSVVEGMMSTMGELTVCFPSWSREVLERRAIAHADDVALERGHVPGDVPVDRLVVNMLRHEFTSYDAAQTVLMHRVACEENLRPVWVAASRV